MPVVAWLAVDGQNHECLLYGWAENPNGADDGWRGLVYAVREYAAGFKAAYLGWVRAEDITRADGCTAPARWPTWLGRWGLGLSILALVIPAMVPVVGNAGGDRAAPSVGLLVLLALVFAILGVVFSSVGMSRRYTRRGLAIAGLVVGIIALAPLFLGVLAGVAAFSLS